jgi:uncharacterized protein YabN with tetrapyrrole methylase and pyrophosphatase domain
LGIQVTSVKQKSAKEGFDAMREIGALLMRVVDLSRAWGVDAELALTKETNRFIDAVAQGEQNCKS